MDKLDLNNIPRHVAIIMDPTSLKLRGAGILMLEAYE